jgi:hypothetical protein
MMPGLPCEERCCLTLLFALDSAYGLSRYCKHTMCHTDVAGITHLVQYEDRH